MNDAAFGLSSSLAAYRTQGVVFEPNGVAFVALGRGLILASLGIQYNIYFFSDRLQPLQAAVITNVIADVTPADQRLYNANGRKVVIMGLAPVGCAPHYLFEYGRDNGECVHEVNDIIRDFNHAMRYMVDELNHNLSDAKITFCDAFEGSMDILNNHQRYGFQTMTDACCGIGTYKSWGMCLLPEMACSDASTHVWWDEFHPTDAANRLLADNIWSGMHTSMCHPMNMIDMI